MNPPIKLSSSGTAERYKSPRVTQEVAKHGQTSGWTTGAINHAVAILKSDPVAAVRDNCEQSEFVVSDEIAGKYGTVGRAYSFSNKGQHITNVMLPGDSGSIVLANEDSQANVPWLGLAFASSRDGTRGYMTPIDVVLHDIEQVTGYRVIMPMRE